MPVFVSGKKKREKFDYRRHYIKHNPGILGRYFICSQCLKPMKVSGMEVDHIFPNSKWFSPNRTFNCVSICPRCNKRKSNKMGFCTVKGIIAKIIEEIYIILHKGLFLFLDLVSILLMYLIQLLLKGLSSGDPVRICISAGTVIGLICFIFNLF